MDKQNVVYMFNEISVSHKKEGKFDHATTWMNLEDTMLSEISQSQKDKYCRIPLIRSTEKSKLQRQKV